MISAFPYLYTHLFWKAPLQNDHGILNMFWTNIFWTAVGRSMAFVAMSIALKKISEAEPYDRGAGKEAVDMFNMIVGLRRYNFPPPFCFSQQVVRGNYCNDASRYLSRLRPVLILSSITLRGLTRSFGTSELCLGLYGISFFAKIWWELTRIDSIQGSIPGIVSNSIFSLNASLLQAEK